jgi:hypothetical protein
VDRAALTAKAEMLIRRPVAEVVEAFVDPAVTSRFWFTRSTGRLEVGRPGAPDSIGCPGGLERDDHYLPAAENLPGGPSPRV